MFIGKLSNRYHKERSREKDPLLPTIFLFVHVVFFTVGTEWMTGWSVGMGWDQIERSGPKESSGDSRTQSVLKRRDTHPTRLTGTLIKKLPITTWFKGKTFHVLRTSTSSGLEFIYVQMVQCNGFPNILWEWVRIFTTSWWWKGEGYYQKSSIVTQVVHVQKPSSCRVVITSRWTKERDQITNTFTFFFGYWNLTFHTEYRDTKNHLLSRETDMKLESFRVDSWCLKYHKTLSRLIVLDLFTHFLDIVSLGHTLRSYTHKFSRGSEKKRFCYSLIDTKKNMIVTLHSVLLRRDGLLFV